ncbi:MAG TPA: PQQ-dependent dehydrogenase, methanol/ethanol family, partial [Bryobacterales bacterium]|nr:PQQ-dependent dehydrogenase, methanol/ethanol family [Bryobacterales bacterium]
RSGCRAHAQLRMTLCLAVALLFAVPPGLPGQSADPGRKLFEGMCAGCHGADGAGGERAPAIGGDSHPRVRALTEQGLRELLHKGVPEAGMPAFDLPETQLGPLVKFVRSLVIPAAENPAPGDAAAGKTFFFGEGRCASCHTVGGAGRPVGPDLSTLAQERTQSQIEQALRSPGRQPTPGYRVVTVRLRNGQTLRGFARNESNYDLQLQDLDGNFHLLARNEITAERREEKSLMPPVQATRSQMENLLAYLTRLSLPSAARPTPEWDPAAGVSFARIASPRPGEWPTYHGRLSGNRYSPLAQVNAGNVAQLAPRWVFPIPSSTKLELTPVVVDGVMYVTSVNEAWALDAATGRPLWHYERPRSKGLVGDASGGINRGVAVLGDRVFLVTDNAHLLALHRTTGALLWDVEMADSRQHYGATSAPLVVNDLVLSGTSGGDEGARGFLAAYKASTGERVWRFATMPAPGEPLAKTSWAGRAIEHGCATAWLTGTYDPDARLLYWPTGNPCPDYNGDERRGDNLYASSVLALDPETGVLRWYYQYTPHDLHDWDGTQTPMLVDAEFHGRPQKLLVQASRNGFFYVLDRLSGKLLQATPFVHKLTWASGIGADGRPQVLPGTDPTIEGVKVCPAVHGATNWMSNAYDPQTGLFYLMALEQCSIFTKSSAWWEPGQSFYGGATRDVPGEKGEKFLRALDLQTGKIVWEVPQIGPGSTWGGVLATAGGVVFFCDDSGAFAAVDAKTGQPLWHFHTNQSWKASPMTYTAGGKQYIAAASGSNVFSFALP